MTHLSRSLVRSSPTPRGSLTLPAIAKLLPALLLAATLAGCATKAQHTMGSLSGKSPKEAPGTAGRSGGAGGGSIDRATCGGWLLVRSDILLRPGIEEVIAYAPARGRT